MGKVVVAGSINMDVVATADRHPQVGETIAGRELLYLPGGKGANQAIAAARLGARTVLIGRLGDDGFSRTLRSFLQDTGVDIGLVRDTRNMTTGTAIITVAQGDNTIVVIAGANAELNEADVANAPLAAGDVAVSQFEIAQPTVHRLFRRARAAGATTLLNPAPASPLDHELLGLVDVLILNETELGTLTGTALRPTDDMDLFVAAARKLAMARDRVICVTLGGRGLVALIDGQPHIDIGRAVVPVDTTGAGDCFVGAVAALLADGQPIRAALGYANVAASICVGRMGAAPAMPTAAEVAAVLRG